MNHTRRVLQFVLFLAVAVGIGCAAPSTTPQATPAAESPAAKAESAPAAAQRSDSFDRPDQSVFAVEEPHKIEGGLLHLQASQEGTLLLSSIEDLSSKGYTVSTRLIPPGVGEYGGLAFAVRGENSRILFYLYRPAGADPFGKRCDIGVDGHIAGRKIRPPDIRVREVEFKPDVPIKLSARQVGPTVFLSIDDRNIGRFNERDLKVGKVGVYGKSQHADGSPAVIKFDSFEVE